MSHPNSLEQAAWRRLKKNKGAVFGMVIIFMAVLLAITAYLIALSSDLNPPD